MRCSDAIAEAELQEGIATAAQYAGWKVMHVRRPAPPLVCGGPRCGTTVRDGLTCSWCPRTVG